MPIPPLPPYVPSYGNIPNVTPFTFRDGLSYEQRFIRLVHYVNQTILPYIETNVTELSESFVTEVNRVIDEVNDQLAAQDASVDEKITALETLVNNAVETILNSSITVQDPMVAAIFGDEESDTREVTDTLYAVKGTEGDVTTLEALVADGARLGEDTLNARFNDKADADTVAGKLVKPGGTAGEVYTKLSETDNDADWLPPFIVQDGEVANPDTALFITPDKWHAPVGAKLTIPTYIDPLGGQSTHPSVVYIAEGWNNYQYWMGHTPYNGGNDAYENPSILASNDGINWVTPAGLVNPLDLQDGDVEYNSDTDLILGPDKRLYLFWRFNNPAINLEVIYQRSSADGINWTPKQTVYQSDQTLRRLVSPCFVYERDGLTMFAVDIVNPASRKLVVLRANVANIQAINTASWTAPTVCSISYQQPGKEIWHIGVKKVGGTYIALITDCDLGVNGTNGDILLAKSNDGINWTSANAPLLPRNNPTFSDQNYRATFVPEIQDSVLGLRIWYGAVLTAGLVWGIYRTFAFSSDPVDMTTVNGAFTPSASMAASPSANKLVKKNGICIARLNGAAVAGGIAANATIATVPVGFRSSDKNVWGYMWGGASQTPTPVYYDVATHTIKSPQALAANLTFAMTLMWDVTG